MPEPGGDLHGLTVAELDHLAAERGVAEYPSHGTKAEKVAVLEAAGQAAAAAPPAAAEAAPGPTDEPEGVARA